MAGFSNITGDESIMFADNASFDGTERGGKLTTNGQLWIGSTASPHVKKGSISSTTLTIGYSSPNITIEAGGTVPTTFLGNTGAAVPVANVLNVVGTSTNGIQTAGAGSTLTTRMNSPYADGDFSFESQTGGTTRTLTVQNTVDAASSQATELVKVAGGSSGDVWTQFSIGSTQSYAIGIDNSDSDILKITESASGTVNPSTASVLQQFDTSKTRAYFPLQFMALGGSTQAAGGIVDSNIQNTSATAASDARLNIQVNDGSGGGGGNAYVAYTGPSNNWYHGVNKTGASSAWQLQQNTSSAFPSATVVMSATTAGEVTFPLTPAFLALHVVNQDNITGNNALVTINFTSEVFDQNADYDGTNTFTAPVTGKYIFSTSIFSSGYVAGTLYEMRFTTSNGSFRSQVVNPTTTKSSAGLALSHSILCDMDAADTCIVQILVNGEGANIIDVVAEGSLTYFSGSLQC